MHARTKELPTIGALGHVRSYLYEEKIWEVRVKFVEEISGLGNSSCDHERTDVIAFDSAGMVGGWRGKYGGSYAMMYEQDRAALATGGRLNLEGLPPETAVLELHRTYPHTYVTLYLNPVHQAKLLPPKPEGAERKKELLKVFKSLKSSFRQGPLHNLKPTQEELNALVDEKYLKCHKGKKIEILSKPIYTGGYPDLYRYFEFNGATITTEGKNLVEN